MVLDNEVDLCYSNGSEGDEDGTKDTSGTFLQGLRDEKVQRGLQRQGPCGSHLQSLFLPLSSTAGRTDDAPPSEKSAPAPFERERDYVTEKSNPRPQARGEVLDLHGLCGAIPTLGKKSEKAGASIQTLTLSINGDICDPYGDPVYNKESYQVSRMPPLVVRTRQDGTRQAIEPPPKILAKLLKWTVRILRCKLCCYSG